MDTFRFTFAAMACTNELQLIGTSYEAIKLHADALMSEVKRIEGKYSRYDPQSALSIINSSAGKHEGTLVDEETAALLDYASAMYLQSEGLFDITSGILRKAWNFREARLPSSSQIEALLPLIGWEKVSWKRPHLVLPQSGMELDFGGVGKEYAVDRATTLAINRGISGGLVNLGGDVRVFGKRPDGAPWSIGIVHPRRMGESIAQRPLKSGALATSGDYERFFEINGRRYSHILDPFTGWPPEHTFHSVSITHDSCLIAGSISTIAMLKGEEGGLAYVKKMRAPYMVVSQGGEIVSGN